MVKQMVASLALLFICSMLFSKNFPDSVEFHQGADTFYHYYKIGQNHRALQAGKKALHAAKNSCGKASLQYVKALNFKANACLGLGKYKASLSALSEAKSITTTFFGKYQRMYRIVCNNLAYLYMKIGCLDKAREIYREIIPISKQQEGRKHPLHPIMLNNLGNIYEAYEDHQKALKYYRKALKLDRHIIKKQPEDQYAINLKDLAGLHLKLGNIDTSRLYFKKAKKYLKENFGTSHSDYGRVLINLADFYQTTGEQEQALHLYMKALKLANKHLSNKHPRKIKCLNKVAGYYALNRQYQKAVKYHRQTQNHIRDYIYHMFSFLSEREKMNLMGKIHQHFWQFLAFTSKVQDSIPETKGMAYNNKLLINNLVLDETRQMRKQIKADAKAETKEQYRQWKELKTRIAKHYTRSKNFDKLDSLKTRATQLERNLVEKSDKFSDQTGSAKWQHIQNELHQNEATIEFVTYQNSNNRSKDTTHYAALVLTPNAAQPYFINLFSEQELETLLNKYGDQEELTFINNLYSRQALGNELYQLIWDQITPLLQKTNTVYYSPAGLLHQLSLSALPHPNEPSLNGAYNLVRLTTTKKLLKKDPEPKRSSISLYGGIQYASRSNSNRKSTFNGQLAVNGMPGYDQTRGFKDSLTFLEGSQSEVQQIKNVLSDKTQSVDMKTGVDASEASFKQLSGNSPNVIHISTHGFFFPDQSVDKPKEDDVTFKYADNPLLRSGLAFAGSNYTWEHGTNPYEEEDGILTAYEIAHMDLSNTDLVVLSACETGLGEVKGSEGVYGLQRAFKLAGVDYLIMSLWKVPDQQTRHLMTAFYKNWTHGKPIRKAFQQAKKELAEDYPPYFWASFVMLGGPIDSDTENTTLSTLNYGWLGFGSLTLLALGLVGFIIVKKNFRSDG